MAARPTWQGHLRLSLVTCPVALYTATSAAGDVHFNLINPKTNNRIRMVTTDPETPRGRSERNNSDGLATSQSPSCFISNTPISLVEPKRFLTARRIRNG